MSRTEPSFFDALLDDGRPLLLLTSLALAFSGGIALFLSCTGEFLPHDVAFLGMQPSALCGMNECRIVHFMIHDRASFGAVLISLAALYAWLALFPLKAGESWAWWLVLTSFITGFGSFLCYLGYGYLDDWHAWATLMLLPVSVSGLALTHRQCAGRPNLRPGWIPGLWRSREGIGRLIWIASSLGLIGAGTIIAWIGMNEVFVPSDLAFIGYTRDTLDRINPRLIPLITHDRAGFGGGVLTTGILLLAIIWKAPPSVHAWQVIVTATFAGFSVAIGVHYPIGYTDTLHLLPAWTGATGFLVGAILSRKRYCAAQHSPGIITQRLEGNDQGSSKAQVSKG